MSNFSLFWSVLAHIYFSKFPIIRVFHSLYKMENKKKQLKIHLVHLFADENEYIND